MLRQTIQDIVWVKIFDTIFSMIFVKNFVESKNPKFWPEIKKRFLLTGLVHVCDSFHELINVFCYFCDPLLQKTHLEYI